MRFGLGLKVSLGLGSELGLTLQPGPGMDEVGVWAEYCLGWGWSWRYG